MKALYILIFPCLFLINSANSFAQTTDIVKWSDYEIERIIRGKPIKYIGNGMLHYMSFHKMKVESMLLSLFENEVINYQKPSWELANKEVILSDYLFMKDNTYLTWEEMDHENDKFRIYTSVITADGLSEPVLTYEHTFENKRCLEVVNSIKYDVEADWFYSSDSSKVVFANQTHADSRGKVTDGIQIAVFDNELKLLWEKVIEFQFEDEKFNAEGFTVSNSGESVYITGVNQEDHRFTYSLFHVEENYENAIELTLQNEEEITFICPLIEENKKNILLFGLYSVRDSTKSLFNRRKGTQGVFTITIDPNSLEYLAESRQEADITAKLTYSNCQPTLLPDGNIQFLLNNIQYRNNHIYSDHDRCYKTDFLDLLLAIDESVSGYPLGYGYDPRGAYFRGNDYLLVTYYADKDSFNIHEMDNLKSPYKKLFLTHNNEIFLLLTSRVSSEDVALFGLDISKGLTLQFISKLYHINRITGEVQQFMLSNSKDAGYYFQGFVGDIIEEKMLFISYCSKNVQSISFKNKPMPYILGQIDLSKSLF